MATHGHAVSVTLFELAGLHLRAVFSQLQAHPPRTLAGNAPGRDRRSWRPPGSRGFHRALPDPGRPSGPLIPEPGGRWQAPGAGMQETVSPAVGLAPPSATTRGGSAFRSAP